MKKVITLLAIALMGTITAVNATGQVDTLKYLMSQMNIVTNNQNVTNRNLNNFKQRFDSSMALVDQQFAELYESADSLKAANNIMSANIDNRMREMNGNVNEKLTTTLNQFVKNKTFYVSMGILLVFVLFRRRIMRTIMNTWKKSPAPADDINEGYIFHPSHVKDGFVTTSEL